MGSTVSSISRKTVALAAGAALAVGGCTAGIVIAVQGSGQRDRHGGTAPARAAAAQRAAAPRLDQPRYGRPGRQRRGGHHRHLQPATARHRAAAGAVPGDRRVLAAGGRRRGLQAGDRLSGRHARHGHGGGRTGRTRTPSASSFKTGDYSTLRLQEILAQLGYLPLTWTPAPGATVPGGSAAAQLSAAYAPPAGTFQLGSRATRRSCSRSGRRARRTPSTRGPSPGSRPTTGCRSTGWPGPPYGRRC